MVNLMVAALSFSTVGTLVACRQRKNPIGWLLLGIGILYATELFAGNYGVYTLDTNPGSLPGGSVGRLADLVGLDRRGVAGAFRLPLLPRR